MTEGKSSLIFVIRRLVKEHGQGIMNIYLFVSFTLWCAWQTWQTYKAGNLDYVEIAFAVQNVILVSLFLMRKEHRAFNKNAFHQSVAVIAFMSGAAFIGQPITGGAVTC